MSDIRTLLAEAESKAIAVEGAKASLEAAKRRVDEAKSELDAVKTDLDDVYGKCEAAGLPKAKARKAVEEIIRVLVEAGVIEGVQEDSKIPAAPRKPRRKAEETSEGTKTPPPVNADVPPASGKTPATEAPMSANPAVADQVEPSDIASLREIADGENKSALELQEKIAIDIGSAPQVSADEVIADSDGEDSVAQVDPENENDEEPLTGEFYNVIRSDDDTGEIPDHVELFGAEETIEDPETDEPVDESFGEPETVTAEEPFAAAPKTAPTPAIPDEVKAPVTETPAAQPAAPGGFRKPSFLKRT